LPSEGRTVVDLRAFRAARRCYYSGRVFTKG